MPEASRTNIEFVSGGQSLWLDPQEVETWALPSWFAVVQDTYRPDKVDMFYDRALWLRLLEFAKTLSAGSSATIIDRPHGTDFSIFPSQRNEILLEKYAARPLEDWYPPERLIFREDGAPVLVIATEYWCQVGGPKEYHDSLTYSIFSKENLAKRVMKFLSDADAATGWNLAQAITPAPSPPPPSLTDQFFSWLRRHA